jgi:adenine-specific DNA-methyltransferase
VSPKHLEEFDLKAEIGDGIFLLSKPEVERLKFTPVEAKYIRPWFKNSDIRRYCCVGKRCESLIYRSSKHSEQKLPNIKKHLSRFKPLLINRNVRAGRVTEGQYDDFVRGKGHIDYVMIASAMKEGNYYCISYARDEEAFNGPKIVCSQRARGNIFGYNEVPWYAGSDVCYIAPGAAAIDLKYVLALLNSKLYFLWLCLRGKRKGELLELCPKPVSEIPIANISPDQQKPLITIVDQIIAPKERHAEADTNELEREIDQLVYALYGLTPEEIKIVEGTSPKTSV